MGALVAHPATGRQAGVHAAAGTVWRARRYHAPAHDRSRLFRHGGGGHTGGMHTAHSKCLATAFLASVVAGLAGLNASLARAQTGTAVPGTPASTPIQCTADFSGTLGRSQLDILIRPRDDQRYDAIVNGTLSHAGLVPLDERVRPGLNLQPDVYGPEYRQYNSAERSLTSLQGQAAFAHVFDHATPPFAPSAVRRVRTFDLTGMPDKFGGHVLLEAYGEDDVLLGRLVRRMVAVPCR